MFQWDGDKSYDININNYIDSEGATRITKKYLSGKSIRYEPKNNYRANLSTGTIVEFLFQERANEIGLDNAVKIVDKMFAEKKQDSVMILKTFNLKFLHNKIDLDPNFICQTLTKYIPTKELWKRDYTELMERADSFTLPYFKSINGRIKDELAETIYNEFQTEGRGMFDTPVIEWLTDNNKHIQELILKYGDEEKYLPKSARDIFLF